jgi:hypothetical protein
MSCLNCGQPMTASDAFCGKCGAPAPAQASEVVLERSTAEQDVLIVTGPVAESVDPASLAAPVMGAPAAVMPVMTGMTGMTEPATAARPATAPRFRLAMDETILKTYEAVQLTPGLLRRKRGQGTLYVTDARVVFYACVYPRGTQRESWLLAQTKLEDVSGVYASVSRRVSLGLLMLTAFFGLATLGTLVTLFLLGTFLFAILTIASMFLLMWDSARRGDVAVRIASREMGTSPIWFGHGARRGLADAMIPAFIYRAYSANDVVHGDPAADADRLIHELGALILDLQTRGTMAYPHWGITDVTGKGHAVGAS